jgi:SAM-dependent methyltransferase
MKPFERWLVYRAVRFVFNFARSADFRSVMLLRWRDPENLFQPFSETSLDRYPEIFRFARDQIGDSAAHRILSFGCATGEEVFSLRRYFPLASIRGLDINTRSIARARRRLESMGDDRISFDVAASAADETGPYNAIFCMAVFRHGGLGTSGTEGRCDHLIRFEDFERCLSDLSRRLSPGGLLFVQHSNFRLCDTALSGIFDVVYRGASAPDPLTPIFDRNNRLLPDTGNGEIGFRKRE